MKLFEIPTDNLYKFMALSGIMMLIVSLIPFYHSYELKLEAIRLNGEIKTLNVQINYLSEDLSELNKEVSALYKETDSIKRQLGALDANEAVGIKQALSDDEKVEIIKRSEEITKKATEQKSKLLQYQEINRKQELTSIKHDNEIQKQKFLLFVIWNELIIGTLGLLFGIILSYKGFLLWYKKLQVPLDKIVQRKLNQRDDQAN